MTMTLFHGGGEELFEGICLTDSSFSTDAAATEKNGVDTITEYEIDLAGLSVLDCGAVRPDGTTSATCPGDAGDAMGADVLRYEETGMWGETHRTWRIMTPRALAALEFIATVAVA